MLLHLYYLYENSLKNCAELETIVDDLRKFSISMMKEQEYDQSEHVALDGYPTN